MAERSEDWLKRIELNCKAAVIAKQLCDDTEISQLFYYKFMAEKAKEELVFEINAYNFAQDEKKKRGLVASVQFNYLLVLNCSHCLYKFLDCIKTSRFQFTLLGF